MAEKSSTNPTRRMSMCWSKLIPLILVALAACSVKLDKPPEPPKDIDSDGDFVSDQEERSIGRNPYLAEVPQLEVQFLQSYSIAVTYQKDGILYINNQEKGEGALMGGPVVTRHIINEAARIARFGSHHHGSLPQKMSWARYPNVSQRSYLDDMERFHAIDSAEIENISIALESTVRLKEDGIYHSIRNLEIDFSYYDHQRGEYRHLGTERADQVFPAGVNRSFRATLLNVPLNLVQDSYFGRGEFIVSNIRDFEIPDMNTTYQQLISNVQKKTITVLYDTPLESAIYYVALGKEGKKPFDSIIEGVFDNQFSIDDGSLKKINQFESNLDGYTYLHELSGRAKDGKWFVFTERVNQHYLDYQFGSEDNLALLYITGETLSKQRKKTIHVSREIVTNDAAIEQIELGEVEANSEIHLRLSPLFRWGQQPKIQPMGSPKEEGLVCEIAEVSLEGYREPLFFEQQNEIELSQISLVIDSTHYKISDLIQNKSTHVFQDDRGTHLHIRNIADIHEFSSEATMPVYLKTMALEQTTPQGIFIKKMEYPSNDDRDYCVGYALGGAIVGDTPIAKSSQEFEEWKHQLKDAEIFGFKFQVASQEDQIYYQNFSLDISIIIIRFYN